jgi:hypothetical protein
MKLAVKLVYHLLKYGTKEMSAKSCRDVLTRKCVGDGIYWISLNSSKNL